MKIQAGNTIQLILKLKKGLPSNTFDVIKSQLKITDLKLCTLPPRTLNRRKKEGKFRLEESEKLYRINLIYFEAFQLFNDEIKTREWLKRPNKVLANYTPLEYSDTELGTTEVVNLINRLKDGVYKLIITSYRIVHKHNLENAFTFLLFLLPFPQTIFFSTYFLHAPFNNISTRVLYYNVIQFRYSF